MIAGTVFTFIGAFLFRFLAIEFLNDHFQHLARARQILLGELPIRDFFDPGLIGQYYASALGLAWSGHNLFGEAILCVLFIAAGAALTFFVSARLSRSFWIALAATFIVIIATPRLYSYPKAFFYVLALAGAWRYAHRPTTGTLAMLAAITVLAFLFRHDHGIYIGLAALALLVILHWPQPRLTLRAIAVYAAVNLVLLLPYLVYVQWAAGLPQYVSGLMPQVRHVSSVWFNPLPITIDRAAPLFVVTPPADRRINVRWGDIDEATRRAREARYGLTKPERVEGSTWSYVAVDERRETIRALTNDPVVVDTHGIDRRNSVLAIREILVNRLVRWVPLLRMHVAPGVFNPNNALAWYYYVTLLVPFVSLATLAALLWRGRINRPEAAVAGMATLLCFIIVQTLVRGSPDSRMADVAGPICVIGAWVTGWWLRAAGQPNRRRRVYRTSLALAFWFVSAWSVGTNAYAGDALTASGILTGPAGIWWRFNLMAERLKERPISTWKRTDRGVQGLGRYVFECTSPSDRVLITYFQPEIFFYAERAFAGGQVYLQPDWHASPADQQLTIQRLQRQRVPIVLVKGEREPAFRKGFPLVYEYVSAHYTKAPASSNQIAGFSVLVDRRITPTGTYDQLGLPCFR